MATAFHRFLPLELRSGANQGQQKYLKSGTLSFSLTMPELRGVEGMKECFASHPAKSAVAKGRAYGGLIISSGGKRPTQDYAVIRH